MTQREFLERIDRHIEQANGHMARGNEHMERGNELMESIREVTLDTRQFMRDLMRRNEIVLGELTREIGAMRVETEAGRRVLVDLHEESVAQRQAILTLIDDLREHGLGGRG